MPRTQAIGSGRDVGLIRMGQLISQPGPPHLIAISERLAGVKHFVEFMALVEKLVPESVGRVLSQGTVASRINAFSRAFSEKYFELPDYWYDWFDEEDPGYYEILRGCPVELQGWTEEDFHELQFGYDFDKLLTLLINPETVTYSGSELRVSWYEMVIADGLATQATLKRLPAEGYSLEDLERYLMGTPHEQAYMFARYLYAQTGISIMDTPSDYENPYADWDEAADIAQAFRRAEAYHQELQKYRHSRERDASKAFTQLLDFLDARMKLLGRPESEEEEEPHGRTLVDIFGEEDQG